MMLGIQLLLLLGVPLIFTILATPMVVRFAGAFGLFDMPEERRIHTNPTPRIGGIAMVSGFMLTIAISLTSNPVGPAILRLLAMSFLMFIVGLWDDLHPLRAATRLLVQVLAGIFTVYSCGLEISSLVLSPNLSMSLPPIVGQVLSVFIVVGAINAVNMIDGMDGLAGGVVLIGISLLTFLHIQTTGDYTVALYLSLPVIGVLLGFLRYNSHPARIFMGDGGSNWLGYLVGVLLLIVLNGFVIDQSSAGNWRLEQAHLNGKQLPLISGLICLAIPIIDTASVIFARLRDGLSPMSPDKRHFHHSLLRMGLSQAQSVGAIYFIALVSGLVGVIPVISDKLELTYIPYVIMLFLAVLIPYAMTLSEQRIAKLAEMGSALRVDKNFAKPLKSFVRVLEFANRYVIYGILFGMPLFSGKVEANVGSAAGFALLLLILARFVGTQRVDFLNSLVFVMSSLVLLVANNMHEVLVVLNGQMVSMAGVYNALFGWLVGSTAVIFVLTFRRKYLIFSASDFLIVLFPIALLMVPEPFRSDYKVETIALRSLVLFMAVQFLARRKAGVWRQIRFVLVNALILVVAMGIFGFKIVY